MSPKLSSARAQPDAPRTPARNLSGFATMLGREMLVGMEWSWDRIDAGRTAVLAAAALVASGGVGLAASLRPDLWSYMIGEDGEVVDKPRRRWIVDRRMWTVWPLTFAGILGALIVLGSIRVEGLYDEATAAWVQAVGVIAAIVATVIVDANATRRTRADRLSERFAANGARLEAIRQSERALNDAAAWIDTVPAGGGGQSIPDRHMRALSGAATALNVLLNQSVTISARLLAITAEAERTMKVALQNANGFNVIVHAVAAANAARLREHRDAMLELVKEAAQAIVEDAEHERRKRK